MDVGKLGEIAAWLEAGAPERRGVAGFRMQSWTARAPCGTVACIGGTAEQWYVPVELRGYFTWPEVGQVLGLSREQAIELFFARKLVAVEESMLFKQRAWATVTPAWAARCIRKLIATGEVDWLGTQEVPEKGVVESEFVEVDEREERELVDA